MRKMNRNIRFLILGMAGVSILCIVVFTVLAAHMSSQNETTMSDVGSLYMASMNERISKHFSTMIDMRLDQMAALTETMPSKSGEDSAELREWLTYNAQIRGFGSLAYLFDDGSYEMLYGEQVKLVEPDLFMRSMNNGVRNVCMGLNAEGTQFAVIGVPFSIKTAQEDKTCVALVGRMTLEYISDTLSLEAEGGLTYSFVLRKDGTFVIHSADAYRHNYFDRVREQYDSVEGMSKEQYIEVLQEAMRKGESYSTMFRMFGNRYQLYCSKMPVSEWYLLTVMPYGSLNEKVEAMGARSLGLAIGSCAIILLALIIVFFIYFNMNQTQLKELKEAKQAAEEASRSKSEFLSNMSHDIRTPMNAIVGMTSIALANSDNPGRVQDCLKKIVLSSKHLLGLINDVLDMSKIESGKMILNVEMVSLREVMDSIVNIVQPQLRAKQQKFDVFIYDISSENVLCDSVRLNQVLINLLSNAIKFTPEGGAIEVSLHETASPKGEGYVRMLLKVKDNGIGMSKEFQEHIFDSFVREDSKRVQKTEGTGLGMAITKYIVDAMGGEIRVESTQNVGTEFFVTLDLERPTDYETEEMILPDFTMLVVDDDQQLCESTVDSLNSIGVRAEWTLDGMSAVKMVEQHHQKHNDYHVILLDWKLPGMDGLETARLLRKELGNEVPILLLSAYDCSEIEEEARAAGITGFLSKPLFRSTLYYGLKPYVDTVSKATEAETKTAALSGTRVLLAEDNELNAEIAQELLTDEGMTLDWAENGQICIEKFEQSPVGYYDAILMDIRMPVKNGYEATEAIRGMDRADANLPIIAMTADAFSEDVQRCITHGMNAHVAKPIDVKEVSRILSRCLEKSGKKA